MGIADMIESRVETGGCLVGTVRYGVEGEFKHVCHCHCSMSRRQSGEGDAPT